MSSVAIIIVSWNTRDLLIRCLESVQRELASFTLWPVETIVVDNASSDQSAEAVSRQFPWVRLVVNQQNEGFARGNNRAAGLTDADILFLLNPDTELKPGALHELATFLDAHLEVGVVGSRLLNPDGTLQTSCYPLPTLSREIWRLFHLDRLHPYGVYPIHSYSLQEPRRVDVVQGSAFMVRRAALDTETLFDVDYFMYSEEFDLCHRIGHKRWQIYWIPQSVVVHYGGQSARQVPVKMFQQFHASKVLYFRKHYEPWKTNAYKLVLLVAALVRVFLSPLALLESRPQREMHLHLAQQYARLLWVLPSF